MKFKTNEEDKSFKPINMSITVETEDEMSALLAFCGRNNWISEKSYSAGHITDGQQAVISVFLYEVYASLKGWD